MSNRLYLVRNSLSMSVWETIDRTGAVIACASSALTSVSRELLDRMIERRCMLIVIVENDAPQVLSAALISDVCAIRTDLSLPLRLDDPVGMAGLVWRIGRSAIPLLAVNDGPIPAEALVRAGVADVLVPNGTDPLEWVRSWLGARSLTALASAARLVRSRGGENAERAEFARLFAAGIPQEGLAAFLERREAGFEDELIVETI